MAMKTESGIRKSFVEESSMSKHEQFEELCALAATGQLSHDEEMKLAEHLRDCERCRAACDEFALILRELPTNEKDRADKALLSQIEKNGLRERFLDLARGEGIRFSDEAKVAARKQWRFRRLIPAYQWIAAGAMAVVLLGYLGFRWLQGNKQQSVMVASNVTRPVEPPAKTASSDPIALQLQQVRSESYQTISALKNENGLLLTRLDALEKQLVASQGDKQSLELALSRASDTNTQLASQNEQNIDLLAQTKAELEKARADRTGMETEVAAERAEIRDLSEQVRLQTASLDRERQLLTAGRDITDLMGARNLHIIDVYDADGKGKNRKSFGRVFYTEGKSLIFYAFDLDEKKLENAKYSFEAWGERLGQSAPVRSLGMLYMDDKAQKRWVLKVDDPEQLAEIDSVFVTIEAHGGPNEKPRGQKVLYAFLGGRANHP
jgi:hypothetical protein